VVKHFDIWQHRKHPVLDVGRASDSKAIRATLAPGPSVEMFPDGCASQTSGSHEHSDDTCYETKSSVSSKAKTCESELTHNATRAKTQVKTKQPTVHSPDTVKFISIQYVVGQKERKK
jgi:hypothetical protein